MFLLPPLNGRLRQKAEHQSLAKQLKRVLPTVFQARPRRLTDLLLRYLRIAEYKGKKEQVDVFGTTSFHVLFEYMCSQVLMHQEEPPSLKAGQVLWDMSILPESLRQKDPLHKGSHQRIDLMTEVNRFPVEEGAQEENYIHFEVPQNEGSQLLILDAKYYDIIGALKYSKGASHLPKLEDIRKQYAYKAWVQKRKQEPAYEHITNGLVFPTCLDGESLVSGEHFYQENGDCHHPFQRLGQVSIPPEEPLFVLGIDLQSLMKVYVKGEKFEAVWLGKALDQM